MGRKIEVVPWDPAWADAYRQEAEALRRVFAPILSGVHHVGSTSVPGLAAKPVVDILVVVTDHDAVPRFDADMEALGYRVRGETVEAGIPPGRFYYSKPAEGLRTHHTHVAAEGNFQIRELLCFARYLRDHPAVAAEYGALKGRAAAAHRFDNVGYMAAKNEWVLSTVRAALGHYGQPDPRTERGASTRTPKPPPSTYDAHA